MPTYKNLNNDSNICFAGPFFKSAENGAVKELPERKDVSEEFQWRVEDIFESDDAWETEFSALQKLIPDLAALKGTLGESAAALLACLKMTDQINERLERLFIYAGLKNDQDTAVSIYQGFRDRAQSLLVQANQGASFINPEILAIPEKQLSEFMEAGELNAYRHRIEDILRSREHVLPGEQEQLLAMSGEMARGPYQIFSMFNNADIRFPVIKDENGNDVEITKGRYSQLMESQDRRVRQDTYQAFYGTYRQWTNTLAATLSASVKSTIFYARARNYPSALAAALHSENIPTAVYDNVVDTINAHLPTLHRYMALRKRVLDVDELRPWDLSVPLVKDLKFEVPYLKAREVITEALHPLGKDYLQALRSGLQGGWIDVYENRGKRSGAYSWSAFGAHPFILMNYNNTLRNVFTLAHELGHALHSYYTHRTQPYHYADYTIFVAEVASTLNEALLMDHMLKTTEDPARKLYLLNEYVQQIHGTVFIQSLFAELERSIYKMAEGGEALTAAALNAVCAELYQRYFGKVFQMDDDFRLNWCRIPHFYYNFYVYKYATGFSAATALSQKILAGDTAARDAYLAFLSSGCSDYSINLLRRAGVDMTSPDPIAATATRMDQLLTEMEQLL